MPLNKVIVPDVRQAAVCVHVHAWVVSDYLCIVVAGSRQPWGVFEQARSAEALFILQGVNPSERAPFQCWHHFSISRRHHHLPFCRSIIILLLCPCVCGHMRVYVCVCVFGCCVVSAPGSTLWSAVFLLSTPPCCWIVCMHVIQFAFRSSQG